MYITFFLQSSTSGSLQKIAKDRSTPSFLSSLMEILKVNRKQIPSYLSIFSFKANAKGNFLFMTIENKMLNLISVCNLLCIQAEFNLTL